MLDVSDVSVRGVAERFGVARSTLYRLLGASPDETAVEDRGE